MFQKKYFHMALGVVIGAVITTSVSISANYLYEVSPNQYPVVLDGKTEAMDGYNIDGYTYFKLRDIGEKVGFTTEFSDNKILINSNQELDPNSIDNNATKDFNFNEITVDGVCYYDPNRVHLYVDDYSSIEYLWGLWWPPEEKIGTKCFLTKRTQSEPIETLFKKEFECVFINEKPYLPKDIVLNDLIPELDMH